MSGTLDRLVVIALSEASPRLIDLFCAEGLMPRLRALREAGLSGRTRYEAPCLLTPQMWATILTGRSAGRHGVFDYWQRSPHGPFRELRGAAIQGPRIWDAFESAGIPAGFINVPMTYPPPRTAGFAVSGQDAPGDHGSIAFPPELHAQIRLRFGRYRHKDIFPGPKGRRAYARALVRETEAQGRFFQWIAQRRDWRFLMLYASGTAFAQHYYWADMAESRGSEPDVVRRTFVAVDGLIGRVLDVLGRGDAVMVISECGAGPIAGGVRLNAWLEQEGFLERRRRGTSASARVLRSIRTLAPQVLPRSAFFAANRLPLKGWIQSRIAADGIDWASTVAFHRGKGEGNIYLNVRGRDLHGSLDPADYEAVRGEIVARLADLRDPATGARAVRAVHRREEIFAGDQLGEAPDLCVEWEDFAYMPAEDGEATGEIFGARIREYMSWPTSGSHRREGFLAMAGEGIGPGRLAGPVGLMDLAPTWIELLGGIVPDDMEGRSVADRLILPATQPGLQRSRASLAP